MKNSQTLRKKHISVRTINIFNFVFCSYLFIFLLSKVDNILFISYITESIVNQVSENFYNLINNFVILFTIIFIVSLIYSKFILFNKKGRQFRHILFIILVLASILVTFLRGKQIQDLKNIGYILINKIEKFYIINNELPKSLNELYDQNLFIDSLRVFEKNFKYVIRNPNDLSINDYRLFINPDFSESSTYIYNNNLKKFVEYD